MRRRRFLGAAAAAPLALSCRFDADAQPAPSAVVRGEAGPPPFRISLAEWSVHRRLRGAQEPKLDHLGFPVFARKHGIEAVEYVSTLFHERRTDAAYLGELGKVCAGEGVRSLLIMIDDEGDLGDPDAARRAEAVRRHHRWVEAAAALGCHAIRVNARSRGSREEQAKLAADGLFRLATHGSAFGIDVIVENHGGLSSDGSWLAEVMRRANHARVGTLPDFGNFRVDAETQYDRYRGVAELMPFARAVSAKSHAFDDAGDETGTDYRRMMKIVFDAGYRGHVGIEFEGGGSEEAGILATKRLLERVRAELAGTGEKTGR